MFSNRFGWRAGLGGCMVLVTVGMALAQELPEVQGRREGRPYPPPTFFAPHGDASGEVILNGPGVSGSRVIWQSGGEPREVIKPSDHWLGLQCGRLSAALRAQLGLDEEQGILVEALVDESPGAKAGIKKYDVLIQAGNRELSTIQDLIDEVDVVKDGKLSVELIREGKKQTLEVTPEKRPEMAEASDETAEDPPGEWQNFLDHMQQWEPGKDGRPSMKFRFWRQPGTIMPNQSKSAESLPGNVKIQIVKEGDKPVEIEVTRDDESWSVKENELDQLPGDVRAHVERMLRKPRGPAAWERFLPEDFKVPNPLEGHESMIEKRFEDMNRRVDQMQKSLEGLLHKGLEKSKPEDKAEPDKKPKPEKKTSKLKPLGVET